MLSLPLSGTPTAGSGAQLCRRRRAGCLAGIIGCIQATEIIKLVLGTGTPLIGRLLLYNALDMRFRELKLRRDPECPICGEHPRITELIDYQQFCGVDANRAPSHDNPDEVTVQEMKRALNDSDLGIRVLDVREPDEYEIVHVHGVQLIPLSGLAQRIGELDPARTYYVHCRSGGRSLKAVKLLQEHGFQHVKSVKGGIVAWAEEIDPTLPKY